MGCGGSTPANEETTTGGAAVGAGGGGGGGKGRKQSQTRRVAVRSDVVDDYDPAKDKTETIPKTDGEKDEIRLALSKSDLFGNVNADDMEILIKRFQSVGVEIGEEVIKQGSDGDLFYIVSSGKYVASLSQQGNAIVAEYGEGESFGELALLYNAPRAASVTCKEGGRLWAIERKVFRYVVITKGAANLQERTDKFLKSISILSPLSDAQRAALAEKLEVLDYADQDYVCKKGEIADALFFIKKGELAVHMGDGKDDVARMKAGDVFGESCLEPTSDDATRKANIVAVGDVQVLKLTAASFKEQIGSLSDVLADQFKRKVMSNVVIEGTRIFDELFPEDQVTCATATRAPAAARPGVPPPRRRAPGATSPARRRGVPPPRAAPPALRPPPLHSSYSPLSPCPPSRGGREGGGACACVCACVGRGVGGGARGGWGGAQAGGCLRLGTLSRRRFDGEGGSSRRRRAAHHRMGTSLHGDTWGRIDVHGVYHSGDVESAALPRFDASQARRGSRLVPSPAPVSWRLALLVAHRCVCVSHAFGRTAG